MGLANAPIVETKFLELTMSLLDFSPRIPLGTFSILLLGECHCWWTRESPRAHVTKFYGRLRLIRSILRASKFSELKLIEIVILWVYYTIPYGFGLFRHFWASLFIFLNTLFGLELLTRVQYLKCAYGPYCKFNPI